jgi:ATP-dependent exoDNAse (exonuclease V) alpha subunit
MALGTERVTFEARVDGNFPISRNNLPVPEKIQLAVGARVMAVKNDTQGRWVNGSLGTITRVIQDGAFVIFDNSRQEHLVSRVSWEKIRQKWNNTQRRIENEVVGAYRQIPLIHAWAVTIHKAQGLTLDDVCVDLGAGAFTPGQVYVALSRVRTMSGLSFAQSLRPADVQADPMLLAFMKWVQSEHLA